MIDDPLLWNDWHPVASVHQLQTNPILSTRLLGEDLMIWQQGTSIQIWRDLCIHRGTKLSLGRIKDDGWFRNSYFTLHSSSSTAVDRLHPAILAKSTVIVSCQLMLVVPDQIAPNKIAP